MSKFSVLVLAAVALAPACGGGGNPPAVDAAKTIDASKVDAFFSNCGEPGDQGNSEGIGKFCTSLGDCSSTESAPLCSIIGDPTTFFCTRTCTGSGSGSDCGSGATCTCNNAGNECGCTPNSCL